MSSKLLIDSLVPGLPDDEGEIKCHVVGAGSAVHKHNMSPDSFRLKLVEGNLTEKDILESMAGFGYMAALNAARQLGPSRGTEARIVKNIVPGMIKHFRDIVKILASLIDKERSLERLLSDFEPETA